MHLPLSAPVQYTLPKNNNAFQLLSGKHASHARHDPQEEIAIFLCRVESDDEILIDPRGTAVILSAGGALAPASLNALFNIRRHLKPSTWSFTLRRLTFALLKPRTANFSL